MKRFAMLSFVLFVLVSSCTKEVPTSVDAVGAAGPVAVSSIVEVETISIISNSAAGMCAETDGTGGSGTGGTSTVIVTGGSTGIGGSTVIIDTLGFGGK
jgi:hypothetical protein